MPTIRIAYMVINYLSGRLSRVHKQTYQSSIECHHGTAAHTYESPRDWSRGKSKEHAAVKPAYTDVSVTFTRAIGSVRRCKRHKENECSTFLISVLSMIKLLADEPEPFQEKGSIYPVY